MGKKLKYLGCEDYQIVSRCDDPRDILIEGKKYKAETYDVHSWHTRIKLVGIDGWFNSVCFEGVPESIYDCKGLHD